MLSYRQNTYNRNKKTSLPVNVILLVSRLIFGLVFVFSGFVKAIDPLGGAYKIEDYLFSFGITLGNLSQFSLVAAIALSTVELFIGISLLLKVNMKFNSILALLFMLIMTPLTLYIAYYNPVTDCGCFGDALIISNWATFWKNIVLLSLAIVIILFSGNLRKIYKPAFESTLTWIIVVGAIALSVYSYRHLPMLDFRPYKVGVNIPEAMKIPDGMPRDVWETTFIYEKEGVQKEFTLENYPQGDSTWTFVDQKTELITKGYEPPIHDFVIIDEYHDDITEDILYAEGYTYLLLMYDVNKASRKGIEKAKNVYQKAMATGSQFYVLTASSEADVRSLKEETGINFAFCTVDPITLKTIIRANPGLVLLKNGTIEGKWNWRDF